jgi:hypothetical protein
VRAHHTRYQDEWISIEKRRAERLLARTEPLTSQPASRGVHAADPVSACRPAGDRTGAFDGLPDDGRAHVSGAGQVGQSALWAGATMTYGSGRTVVPYLALGEQLALSDTAERGSLAHIVANPSRSARPSIFAL